MEIWRSRCQRDKLHEVAYDRKIELPFVFNTLNNENNDKHGWVGKSECN
jgi:hypothetical protein